MLEQSWLQSQRDFGEFISLLWNIQEVWEVSILFNGSHYDFFQSTAPLAKGIWFSNYGELTTVSRINNRFRYYDIGLERNTCRSWGNKGLYERCYRPEWRNENTEWSIKEPQTVRVSRILKPSPGVKRLKRFPNLYLYPYTPFQRRLYLKIQVGNSFVCIALFCSCAHVSCAYIAVVAQVLMSGCISYFGNAECWNYKVEVHKTLNTYVYMPIGNNGLLMKRNTEENSRRFDLN